MMEILIFTEFSHVNSTEVLSGKIFVPIEIRKLPVPILNYRNGDNLIDKGK